MLGSERDIPSLKPFVGGSLARGAVDGRFRLAPVERFTDSSAMTQVDLDLLEHRGASPIRSGEHHPVLEPAVACRKIRKG